jgi:drug/metabolite transporter (DMT)-like permease
VRKLNINNWPKVLGAILILLGALSILLENGTALHTGLQITFVLGCVVYLLGNRIAKRIGVKQ